jgi:hypothetical protein
MPRGPKGEKRPADVIGAAVMVAKIATGEIEDVHGKSPGRVAGGKIGGRNRANSLTPERKAAIASVAAKARWKKEQKDR